jgi:sigma-B regulation protein RsbU (phosphoserine phosphatase)
MATQEELSRAFLKRVEGGVAAFAARLGENPGVRALYADGTVLRAALRREEALRHFRTETPVLGFLLGQAGRDGAWYYSLDENGGVTWLPSILANLSPFAADGTPPASARWRGPVFHIPDPGVGRHAALLFGLPVTVTDGGPPLWIGAVLGMPWIENTLRGLSGFARPEPFFCNSEGEYVIFPPGRSAGRGPQNIFEDAELNGLPALATLGQEMLAGKKIVAKLRDGLETAPGQPVWPLPWSEPGSVAVYPMSVPGWHLGMIAPNSEIGNGPPRLSRWLVLTALLAPLLTGAVTWVVTRRTTAPLRALADALENLGRGDLDTPFPAPETADEAGLMLRSFEKARVILKASFWSLAKNAARQQSLRDELALARAIQESMLPAAFPKIPAAAARGRLVMAREVCGDLYDCFRLDESQPSRLALVIGDVCGKGIPAALIMSGAMSLARSFLLRGHPPAETLEKINAALLRKDHSLMFVTMLIGIYDANDGRFTWASAGHPPPMLGPAPNSSPKVDSPAQSLILPWSDELVLGVAPNKRYTTFSAELEPGQALLLYTDGAEDAMDAGEEDQAALFGEERLARSFSQACAEPPREGERENNVDNIVRRVAEDLDAHMAGAPPHDDISLLVLRRDIDFSRA